MARRSKTLDAPRDLRIIEDMDGFVCAMVDRDASKQFGKRTMYFHLAMMVLFITVIFTIPAWLAAAANILLSAQLVSWRVRCRAHGVEIDRLYTRGDASVSQVRGEDKGKGPLPLGLGQPEDPLFLAFSEMERVAWTEWSLRFHMADGEVHELRLELTPPADIERLGRKLRDVQVGFAEGVTVSREQAERDLAKLAAMARASRPVHQ